MLGPQSLGYKKYHRQYPSSLFENHHLLPVNGGYGIKALTYGTLTRLQLSALLKYLRRNIKKTDKFWFTIFPSIMVTRKGLGARMGKGKGVVDDYVAQVRRGRLLIEFGGFFLKASKLTAIFNACSSKLPLGVKLIRRKL